MPFEVLPTIARKLMEVKASVSYMRYRPREDRRKRQPHEYMPRLVIGIPKAVVAAPKKAAVTSYVFQIGSGNDAGKARLVPTDKGGVTPHEFGGGLSFRFGYVPLLGDDAAERELVEVRPLPNNGGFELTLPAWFKKD